MASTSNIAAWTTTLNPDNVPQSTYRAAVRSLYNYLGCALHGSSHPTVARASVGLRPFFGQPTSLLFGTSHRTDAQHAALLNGIASHVHDYDDTHLATIIHPTGPVASALLAYVQHVSTTTGQKTSGSALLTALIAGIEVECKLGLAVYPRHYDIGWHITSTTGAIGAAVAVATLMGLTEVGVANAVGIAATQVTGLRCNFGSDTKPFHIGRAAQNGLIAAILAAQGFTSDEGPIEAKKGWANTVTGGQGNNDEVRVEQQVEWYISELGKVWEVEKNSFKPFPCGIVAHPAIDAAIQMRQEIITQTGEQGLLAELARLKFKARVNQLVIELTSNKTPRNGLEAKFSVFHGIAVGLIYGKAGPGEYEDEVVKNSDVVRVRDSIEATADGAIKSDETVLVAFESTAAVPVHAVHVEHAVGSLDVPMTDEQLTQKFVDQVAMHSSVERAQQLSELCWKVREAEDVNDVLNQLSL